MLKAMIDSIPNNKGSHFLAQSHKGCMHCHFGYSVCAARCLIGFVSECWTEDIQHPSLPQIKALPCWSCCKSGASTVLRPSRQGYFLEMSKERSARSLAFMWAGSSYAVAKMVVSLGCSRYFDQGCRSTPQSKSTNDATRPLEF